ncbi:hypothetical protein I4U23_003929 [Adineta vaga]|nr:hypothetical protein I4U23_003929 [Adineta vaga]
MSMVYGKSEEMHMSALYNACRNNCVREVRRLLKRLKSDEINRVESNGSTALHVACYHNHMEIVRFLLKRGADRSIRNRSHNMTPYEEASDPLVRNLFYLIRDSRGRRIRADGIISWTIIVDNFTRDNVRAMIMYLEHMLCRLGLVTMLTHLRKHYIPHLNLPTGKREKVEQYFDNAIETRSVIPIIRAYTLSEFSRTTNEYMANTLSQRIQIDTDHKSLSTSIYYLASIITFTSHEQLSPTTFDTFRGIIVTEDEFKKYRDGDIIVNTAIVSTSKDQSVALMFANNGDDHNLRHNRQKQRLVQISLLFRYRFLPGSTRTMEVKHISEFQDELEVLIKPLSTFKVENRRVSIINSVRVIIVDMIECEPSFWHKDTSKVCTQSTENNNDAHINEFLCQRDDSITENKSLINAYRVYDFYTNSPSETYLLNSSEYLAAHGDGEMSQYLSHQHVDDNTNVLCSSSKLPSSETESNSDEYATVNVHYEPFCDEIGASEYHNSSNPIKDIPILHQAVNLRNYTSDHEKNNIYATSNAVSTSSHPALIHRRYMNLSEITTNTSLKVRFLPSITIDRRLYTSAPVSSYYDESGQNTSNSQCVNARDFVQHTLDTTMNNYQYSTVGYISNGLSDCLLNETSFSLSMAKRNNLETLYSSKNFADDHIYLIPNVDPLAKKSWLHWR